MGSISKKFKKNPYNLNSGLSPFKLSGKFVKYICPKCNNKIDAPIEAVLEFEQDDELNNLPISTPPYVTCSCGYDKAVPIDYHSRRGFHHVYKID